MVIRQLYYNGKDSVTVRMFYNDNRIVERVEEVRRLDLFETNEYILPHIEVTNKQLNKILRSLKGGDSSGENISNRRS